MDGGTLKVLEFLVDLRVFLKFILYTVQAVLQTFLHAVCCLAAGGREVDGTVTHLVVWGFQVTLGQEAPEDV